jgi:hypothetical protein
MPNCVAPIGDHCHPHSRSVSNFLHPIVFQIHPSIYPSIYAFLFASIVLLHWKVVSTHHGVWKRKNWVCHAESLKYWQTGTQKNGQSHLKNSRHSCISMTCAACYEHWEYKIKWYLLQTNSFEFLKWLCGIKNDICCLVIHFANQMLSDEDIKRRMIVSEWIEESDIEVISWISQNCALISHEAIPWPVNIQSCQPWYHRVTWSFSLHLKSCSYDR